MLAQNGHTTCNTHVNHTVRLVDHIAICAVSISVEGMHESMLNSLASNSRYHHVCYASLETIRSTVRQ